MRFSSPPWKRCVVVALALCLIGLVLGSAGIGSVRIPLDEALRILGSRVGILEAGGGTTVGASGNLASGIDPAHEVILVDLRMPRVLMAALAGAALALAGAGMQGLFRNPLADPSLIGVSAGAAMGAVTAAVLQIPLAGLAAFFGPFWLPVAAFTGGLATTALVHRISKVEGRTPVTTLLLTGIAVNALAGAFIGFMTYLSTNAQLRDFAFWSLGSLAGATWQLLGAVALVALVPSVLFMRLARPLNALLLGEAEAHHLGVNLERTRLLVVFLGAALVGASVAACGIISFVGLVVPHLVRLVIGPDHRYLFPASALLGGMLLVVADVFARTVVAPAELPVGIVTALFGAPFFLGLLHLSRKGVAA